VSKSKEAVSKGRTGQHGHRTTGKEGEDRARNELASGKAFKGNRCQQTVQTLTAGRVRGLVVRVRRGKRMGRGPPKNRHRINNTNEEDKGDRCRRPEKRKTQDSGKGVTGLSECPIGGNRGERKGGALYGGTQRA